MATAPAQPLSPAPSPSLKPPRSSPLPPAFTSGLAASGSPGRARRLQRLRLIPRLKQAVPTAMRTANAWLPYSAYNLSMPPSHPSPYPLPRLFRSRHVHSNPPLAPKIAALISIHGKSGIPPRMQHPRPASIWILTTSTPTTPPTPSPTTTPSKEPARTPENGLKRRPPTPEDAACIVRFAGVHPRYQRHRPLSLRRRHQPFPRRRPDLPRHLDRPRPRKILRRSTPEIPPQRPTPPRPPPRRRHTPQPQRSAAPTESHWPSTQSMT